jgi:hypothetical protein
MTNRNFLALAGAAIVLLAAGIWLNARHAGEQGGIGGAVLFADLEPALGDVEEIRISKGDGSRTTIRRGTDGWSVVERNYPADGARVRELALNLAAMKVVEPKTSDPANYPKLGVEPANTPTAGSTLVELVAGKKTWSLLVGKSAEGRAVYVRKPDDKASALAAPTVSVDPDQKRWLDREITDIPGAEVHDIAVTPAKGPAYLLTRRKRGDADLALSPIPKGRSAVSSMSLNGQGEVLAAFNFDDVHPLEGAPPEATDKAVWRTFDGQVIEFAGHRTADKAFVTVTAHRDPALAAQFAEAPRPAPAADAAAKPADAGTAQASAGGGKAGDTKSDAAKSDAAKSDAAKSDAAKSDAAKSDAAKSDAAKPDADKPAGEKSAEEKPSAKTVERLAARAGGVQYEIPGYKYDALFKPEEELLEKPPAPAAKPKKK